MGDQTIDTYLAFLLFHGPGFVGLAVGEGVGAGKRVDSEGVVVVRCRLSAAVPVKVVDILPILHMPLYMQRTYTYVVGVGYIRS
jgi:hypothetical protein